MAILKGELQADNGDVLYPHTSSQCVFAPDGKTVYEQIRTLLDYKYAPEGITHPKDLPSGRWYFTSQYNPIPSNQFYIEVGFNPVSGYKQLTAYDPFNPGMHIGIVANEVWAGWINVTGTKIITNPNEAILNGKYKYSGSLNMPSDGTWLIDVTVEDGGRIFQTANCIYSTDDTNTYTRRSTGPTGVEWTPWKRIATTDKIDISLQNGWSDSFITNKRNFTAVKVGDIVTFTISIKDGTYTSGTVLFNIPMGFRPKNWVAYPSTHANSSWVYNGNATVQIKTNGDCSLVSNLTGNARLVFCASYEVA